MGNCCQKQDQDYSQDQIEVPVEMPDLEKKQDDVISQFNINKPVSKLKGGKTDNDLYSEIHGLLKTANYNLIDDENKSFEEKYAGLNDI